MSGMQNPAKNTSRREKKIQTGWGKVAGWYHDAVEEAGSYQRELILPNLLRLMDVKKGETILDLACGEGFFSERFHRLGGRVIGVDVAAELIAIVKKRVPGGEFHLGPADKLDFLKNNSVDKIAIVLALQNIENVQGALAECARVLKPSGKLFIILNHPAFRIPKQSSWGYDPVKSPGDHGASEKGGVQYRRIDRYLSESREKIQIHPGEKPSEMTVSFHKPLQFYFKAFKKSGLAVTGLEEWSSNKKSQPGPRAEAENRARKEIPLFLFLEASKI